MCESRIPPKLLTMNDKKYEFPEYFPSSLFEMVKLWLYCDTWKYGEISVDSKSVINRFKKAYMKHNKE